MVLTACSALSLVNRAFLPPSLATMQAHRGQLDASVGASGPHGFAVRRIAPSSEAPPASIASRPTLVTIRETPLDWGGTADSLLLFLPRRQAIFGKSEIKSAVNLKVFLSAKAEVVVSKAVFG